MVMVIVSVIAFVAVGIYLIVKRVEAARGFSLAAGATAPPAFMVALGIGFFILAGIFILFYTQGIIGRR